MTRRDAAGRQPQEPKPAFRRRLLPAVVVVAVLLVAFRFFLDGRTSLGAGPLASPDVSDHVTAGQGPGNDVVTFGHVILQNRGKSVAILDGVSFIPPLPANLELLGIQVASDPAREIATVGAVDGYPPEGYPIGRLSPLKGAEVAPKNTPEGERGTALIMGFRLHGDEAVGFRQVQVDYHIADKRYRAKLDHAFTMCRTPSHGENCPEADEPLTPEGG